MTTELTPTGLTVDRFVDLITDMDTESKGVWGDSVDLSQEQLLGHLQRLTGLSLSELNEAFEATVDVLSALNVSGVRLDHLFALIGLDRQSAAKSTVTLTYTVDRATTIPTGHKVKTSANVIFQTTSDLVFTAAGSDSVAAECTEYGAYEAAIGDVDTPVTTVDGVTAVTNAAAAIPGRLRGTDPEFRAAHTAAVATSGEDDVASIYEALLQATGVSHAHVEEDDDANNITCSVIGGSDADVAAAINNNRTGGIPTVGTTSVYVYSSTTGQTKTINFYRAADRDYYVDLTLAINDSLFPDDGEDQIRAALVALADQLRIKGTVDYMAHIAPIYTVAGVTLSDMRIGWSASPTGTANLTTTITQRPNLETANISVSYI